MIPASPPPNANARRPSRALLGAAALALAALFVSLGLWQLSRGQEKAAMLARHERALDDAPRDLTALLREGEPQADALPVSASVRGTWLERPVLLLDNRIRDGRAGIEVYRPLALADSDAVVLVELGWLPWGPAREMPALATQSGEFAAQGLLKVWPGAGIPLGSAEIPQEPLAPVLLTRLEHDAVAARVPGVLPAAVFSPDPGVAVGYARHRDALPNTLPPSRHRGYAFQWFALAAAVVIVYGVLLWRHRRPT